MRHLNHAIPARLQGVARRLEGRDRIGVMLEGLEEGDDLERRGRVVGLGQEAHLEVGLVAIDGPLDAPRVQVDAAGATAGGVPRQLEEPAVAAAHVEHMVGRLDGAHLADDVQAIAIDQPTEPVLGLKVAHAVLGLARVGVLVVEPDRVICGARPGLDEGARVAALDLESAGLMPHPIPRAAQHGGKLSAAAEGARRFYEGDRRLHGA